VIFEVKLIKVLKELKGWESCIWNV